MGAGRLRTGILVLLCIPLVITAITLYSLLTLPEDAGDTVAVGARYAEGIAAYERGNYERAAGHFRAVLAVIPHAAAADVYNSLGLALERSGDLAGAQAALETAIDLDPAHYTAHINLGVVYWASGKQEAARAQWRAVMHAAPQSPAATQASLLLAEASR